MNYIGNVKHKDLIRYYNEADIFIFASSCETFGMILLEAMASGLPIACSKISSMPEILKQNGEYFNPKDPESISKAIMKIISNINKFNYSKKRQIGLKIFLGKNVPIRHSNTFSQLCKKVIGKV